MVVLAARAMFVFVPVVATRAEFVFVVALVELRVPDVVVPVFFTVAVDVFGRVAVARCVVVRDTVCGAGLRDTVVRCTLSLERVVTFRVVVAPESRVVTFGVALSREAKPWFCVCVTTVALFPRALVFVVRTAASVAPMHKKHTAKKGSILLILTFC